VEVQHLSLAEIKALLEKEKKERGGLSQEQQYALAHAQAFTKIGSDEVKELVRSLMEIPLMTPEKAYKIADMLPTQPDDLRAIFAKERYALSKEDSEKVLQLVAKYI